MKSKFFVLTLSLFLIAVPFASECIPQKVLISGALKDANEKDNVRNGKITVIQDHEKIEQATDVNGEFELLVNPGIATIIYQAPGYSSLEDTITVKEKNNKNIDKKIHKNSVSGWWTMLLLVPGVFGLLVAWCKENFDGKRAPNKSIQDRLLVALVNGLVWAVVLSWIWYSASLLEGITKIQFFHRSLTFEFFVPLLGFFGSLLYVFDLFRGKDSDSFKDKEFGMRIIMGPYVAIVIVSLFGREFDVINLESDTGQGALAFTSGLIVVVALQGIIERANEMLGKWRRKNNPYVASPLAQKFGLSEDEDKALRKISLRYPYQLSMWSDDDLCRKLADVQFDKHLALAMKRSIELDDLKSDISNLIWERLKPINITTIEDFSTLSNKELRQIAKEKPELSDRRLIELRDNTIEFLKRNGAHLT